MICFEGVGNYRGDLHAKEEDGRYFWAVECDMECDFNWDWQEIPKELFDALEAHYNTALGDDE